MSTTLLRQLGFLALLLSLSFSTFGQTCSPDPQYSNEESGLYPLPDNSPNHDSPTMGIYEEACVGQYFEFPMTVIIEDMYEFQGLTFDIDSMVLHYVNNLPVGISYNCSPDCVFEKNTEGCINLFGTPTQADSDSVEFSTTIYFNSNFLPQLDIVFPDPNIAEGEYTFTVNSCNLAPTSNFSAQTTTGCTPFSVNYIDGSSAATSWSWSFPGGTPNISTQQNPTVTYNNAGTFNASLSVTNDFGTDTETKNNYINVNASPTADFTYTATGLTADFTNTSSNATTYSWDFGDGMSSSQAAPSHTYASAATYTVSLTATNSCGNQVSTQSVVLSTMPVAAFSATTTEGCVPFTVAFTDNSSSATSWNWSFPGGSPTSSTQQNPSVTYNNPGSFDVSLSVSNTQGTDATSQASYITVSNQPPVPNFSYTDNNLTLTFSNGSSNATTYSWSFGDGMSSNLPAPFHTYGEPGVYQITLAATGPCGTQSTTQVVTVGNQPAANFTSSQSTNCAPVTVSYFDQSIENPTMWSWTFPGGTPATSTQQNPTVSYTAAGTFDASLTVSNQLGANSISKPSHVTVTDVPETDFTFIADNGLVTFTNTTTAGTAFSWNFGDGTSSSLENPTHTYTASDTYTVTLSATNNCGTSTSSQLVTTMITGINTVQKQHGLSVFPNPTTGTFWIEGEELRATDLSLSVYTIAGRLVQETSPTATNGVLETSLAALSTGVYFIRIQAEGKVYNLKVILE